jgi:hypothetical protein
MQPSDHPIDTQFTLNGLCYKIGRFKKVLVWVNGEWIKSTKEPEDLQGKGVNKFRDALEAGYSV